MEGFETQGDNEKREIRKLPQLKGEEKVDMIVQGAEGDVTLQVSDNESIKMLMMP